MSLASQAEQDPIIFVDEPEEVKKPFWVRHSTILLLVVIMLGAAFFRFIGRDFDQGHNQHPDERAIIDRTMVVRWPSSFQQLLDPHTSPLNLRSDTAQGSLCPNGCEYPWGSLPVYLTRAAAWGLDTFLPVSESNYKGYYLNDYNATQRVGRTLASIFDLITVLLVFLIARRLYSSGTALIAAALVAFAVTEIQIAHYYISEPFLVCFMVGALYFSVVLMQKPSWWAAAGAGACLGFAIASKVTIAFFGLIIIAAIVLRAAYRLKSRNLGAALGDPVGMMPATVRERSRTFRGHFLRGLRYFVIAAVFTLIAFSISEPYALWQFDFSRLQSGVPGANASDNIRAVLESNPWTRRIAGEAAVQSGEADVPFTRQYIGTIPILYHAEQLVLWGMGVLPGLIGLAGIVRAFWLAIKRRPAEILLLAGAIPYFLTIMNLESKWMRYMLPLVPIVAILGAAFLARGMVWARQRYTARQSSRSSLRYLQRNFFTIVTALTIGFAFFWTVAFANIYTKEHSRVQASEWIYDNVPDGSNISSEGWDDGIPFGLPSVVGEDPRDPGSRQYRGVTFNLYDDRAPEDELAYLSSLFKETDYIVLTSNRLYGSVPRLPWRYPVQTRYYQLLFAEKLGYVRVHTTQVTPELFGIKINDQLADESFSVYDHPRVDIFKKITALTDDQLNTLFATALDRPLGQYTTQRHGTVLDDKSLMLDQPLADLPVVDDLSWNPLAQGDTQWIGVLLWLVAVYLLGFAAMPIVFTIFKRLPDKGYPLAKIVGLLIVSWAVWILASAKLIPFTVWTVAAMLLLLGGLGLLLWKLGANDEIRDFVRNKRRLIFFYEGLFLVAFAAFLFIRMLNPDLWHPTFGGEKPMEFGFLNAILRSPWMPPADPFFADGYINYYYQGQFIIACLIKLIGVDPAIGFNLAIPLLYALTFSGAACLVYNIVAWSQRRRGSVHQVSRAGMAFAVLGGVLMLVIGNLHGLMQLIMIGRPDVAATFIGWGQNLGFIGPSWTSAYNTFNFWDPSRIINGTINEFPFWSFLFADLHPHLIDMPFTLLAASFAMNLAFAGRFVPRVAGALRGTWGQTLAANIRAGLGWLWGSGWSGLLNFAVMALALGALFAINSWDFPTYLGIAGGAIFIALLLSRQVPARSTEPDAVESEPGSDPPLRAAGAWSLIGISLVSFIVLAIASLIAYLPFFLNFKAFFNQIMPLVDGGTIEGTGFVMSRTSIQEYLVVWAIFVFIAVSYLLVRLWNFPWRAAFADLARLLPGGHPETEQVALSPMQVFRTEPEPVIPTRRVRRLDLAPSFSTGSGAVLAYSGRGSEDDFASSTSVTEPRREHISESADETEQPQANADLDKDSPLTPESVFGLLDTADPDDLAFHPDPLVVPTSDEETVGLAALESEDPADGDYMPMASNWVAEAHSEAQRHYILRTRVEQPGVIPLWAGLGLLAVTAGLVLLQVATHQLLLALLIALIGGLTATLLSTTRSVAALFGGLLLVTALLVSLGVEVVYLADHLQGGDSFRMNTVFKFYIQVWILFAAGGAVAIYYILYGVKERLARRNTESLQTSPGELPYVTAEDAFATTELTGGLTEDAAGTYSQANGSYASQPALLSNDHPSSNWMVWSADEMDAAPGAVLDANDETAYEFVDLAQEASNGWEDSPQPAAAPVNKIYEQPQEQVVTEPARLRWTLPRLLWTAVFALFMFASLIFTVYGTQDRVRQRFPNPPVLGTLDGMRYMNSAQYGTSVSSASGEVGLTVNLKYDYEGINWMNENIRGLVTIAELPVEYYRADGMRVATNTGLPMVVGNEHESEQRSSLYARLVDNRRLDMNEFFTTNDVQRALTLISKYDIKYIYLGQLEQARAGDAGMKKFQQMADPKIGILEQVFASDQPEGVAGTVIYKVSTAEDKDPKLLVGVPVANSGIPGISITPLPTNTPIPPPTPPVDNPELKALIADVAAHPSDRDARIRLSTWYRDNGYPLEAAKELQILVNQDPANVALSSQLGDLYEAANEPDLALQAWEKGRDAAPDNPDARNKVGVAYFQRKRFDDAQVEFQAAVKAAPTFIESWVHLGEVAERKGDLEGAMKAYQSAIDNSKDENSWKRTAQDRLSKLK
ncbi:MAG: DUF2298 domain-containing protein [Chloroflexota bacterium]